MSPQTALPTKTITAGAYEWVEIVRQCLGGLEIRDSVRIPVPSHPLHLQVFHNWLAKQSPEKQARLIRSFADFVAPQEDDAEPDPELLERDSETGIVIEAEYRVVEDAKVDHDDLENLANDATAGADLPLDDRGSLDGQTDKAAAKAEAKRKSGELTRRRSARLEVASRLSRRHATLAKRYDGDPDTLYEAVLSLSDWKLPSVRARKAMRDRFDEHAKLTKPTARDEAEIQTWLYKNANILKRKIPSIMLRIDNGVASLRRGRRMHPTGELLADFRMALINGKATRDVLQDQADFDPKERGSIGAVATGAIMLMFDALALSEQTGGYYIHGRPIALGDQIEDRANQIAAALAKRVRQGEVVPLTRSADKVAADIVRLYGLNLGTGHADTLEKLVCSVRDPSRKPWMQNRLSEDMASNYPTLAAVVGQAGHNLTSKPKRKLRVMLAAIGFNDAEADQLTGLREVIRSNNEATVREAKLNVCKVALAMVRRRIMSDQDEQRDPESFRQIATAVARQTIKTLVDRDLGKYLQRAVLRELDRHPLKKSTGV